jgi:hypothetical protein
MSHITANSLTYFETVEDHFRITRGTGFFRSSPLDWALVEAWHEAGIPLEAVLRGIDRTFEICRKRPARARTQMINSISYCAQAIAAEAQIMADATPAEQNSRHRTRRKRFGISLRGTHQYSAVLATRNWQNP